MTNAHCQDCGDPIFRYDGQEFCPTCQKAVQQEAGQGGESDSEAGDEAAADGERPASNGDREKIHVAAPDDTRVQFGGEEGQEADAPADSTAPQQAPSGQPQQAPSGQGQPGQPAQAPQQPAPGQYGDLCAAHASLSRTVQRLASQAEASEELDQKRALLAATREAAEALSAVRDANR
jgi:uncharacterized Zn finger protein (UPF0148 family)